MRNPSAPALLLLSAFLAAGCAPAAPTDTDASASSSTAAISSSSASDMSDTVVLDSPVAGAVVKSPLTITGKARGRWFFEATFPVELQDANGVTIADSNAKANGDWQTTDFVPFTAMLKFKTTETSGFLVLKNDNESGLPQYDQSIRIPVQF